jgi:hypothetical protein
MDKVLPNGSHWHAKPQDALEAIQCKPIPEIGQPNWNCVLRRCKDCPAYEIPMEEQGEGDDDPAISFHHYCAFTNCTRHGSLALNAKECGICDNPDVTKKGKIRTRKHLTLLTRPIGRFLKEFYLPALEKYSYHLPHVMILSKVVCGKMRQDAFAKDTGSIKTRRDYAERLSAIFNMEVQSEHFGNGRSLSIEGSSVETYIGVELNEYLEGRMNANQLLRKMEFHSHFSDFSRQDAATTNAHMTVLLEVLKQRLEFREGSTMYDDTDGCAKQYRCGNALYLLSVLSCKFKIVIDRAVGAPGHGKDLVDGLNATDKKFLRS